MNKGSIYMDGEPHDIFSRYEELESIGLSAPQVTYALNALKQAGLNIRTDIITIGEAAQEIYRSIKGK